MLSRRSRLCSLLSFAVSVCAVTATCSAQDLAPGRSAHDPGQPNKRTTVWEVEFPDGITMEEYARQLDHFGIEIAVADRSGQVDYISEVSKAKPKKRRGYDRIDDRWRVGWRKGNLHTFDRRLLSKAGIGSDTKELWHYFPKEVETRMAELERAFADREPDSIRRTRFGLRSTLETGYQLYVIEQEPAKE